MVMGDKTQHAAEGAAGTVKETAGKVTGDEDLEAEGRREQAKAELKKAGDKLGDAAKRVADR
jgi:uncharacterized protein YjbJ (UPF0337 family)